MLLCGGVSDVHDSMCYLRNEVMYIFAQSQIIAWQPQQKRNRKRHVVNLGRCTLFCIFCCLIGPPAICGTGDGKCCRWPTQPWMCDGIGSHRSDARMYLCHGGRPGNGNGSRCSRGCPRRSERLWRWPKRISMWVGWWAVLQGIFNVGFHCANVAYLLATPPAIDLKVKDDTWKVRY